MLRGLKRLFSYDQSEKPRYRDAEGRDGEVHGCQAPAGDTPKSLCDTVIERVQGMVTESAVLLNEKIRAERSAAEKKREQDEWLVGVKAYGEELAKAKEAELLPGKTDLINRYVGEHLTDVKSYSFACVRYGDFLAVNISRGDRHISQTLNVAETRGIELKQGWEPLCDGKVYYKLRRRMNGGYCWSGEIEPCDRLYWYEYDNHGNVTCTKRATREELCVEAMPPSDTTKWEQLECSVNRHRPILLFQKKKHSPPWSNDHNDYMREHHPNRCQLTTENYPRIAKDDQIIFEGIGCTLFIPAGLGAGVYAQILKAPDTLKVKKR